MPKANVIKDATECLGVFVRPAHHSDTEQLITLNQNFRYEMAQWEAGHIQDSDESGGYPVLDAEDVNFILTQEDPANLIVIGRRLESEERLIGYSYSYTEPWESSVQTPAKRTLKPTPRKKKGKGKEKVKARVESPSKSASNESLYLAELFISQCERGFGLGELLLTGTLHTRKKRSGLGSHLFVSSKNISAVKCYQKFGYDVGNRPSGDRAHDLVMELDRCQDSVSEAFSRLEKQLADGTLGTTRRRRRPSPQSEAAQSKAAAPPASTPSPPSRDTSFPSNKPCRFVPESSESRASNAPTENAPSSRSSSRSSPSITPNVIRPQPTRIILPQNKRVSTRRVTRSGAAVSPLFQGNSLQSMQGFGVRQRKSRNTGAKSNRKKECDDLLAGVEHVEASSRKGTVTRRSLKPKFLFTGMRSSLKQAAEDGLRKLGCEVIGTETYDPRCSHVVASHPIRTEKFLCAIAAGKHLLQPAYVFDSVEHGKLLPEDDYLWVQPRCAGVQGIKVGGNSKESEAFAPTGSASAHSSGCFLGMIAVMVPSDSKQCGLKRVLEAGNATIRCSHHLGSDVSQVTHAFVASRVLDDNQGAEDMKALEMLESLQSLGVHCLREEFIVDFLTSEKPITEEPYLVSPAKMRRGGKRKSAEEARLAAKRSKGGRVA